MHGMERPIWAYPTYRHVAIYLWIGDELGREDVKLNSHC
jgi:hypothetical protein